MELSFQNVKNKKVLDWLYDNSDELHIDIIHDESDAPQPGIGVEYNYIHKSIPQDLDGILQPNTSSSRNVLEKHFRRHFVKPLDVGGKKLVKGLTKDMNQDIVPFIDSTSSYIESDEKALWLHFTKYGYVYLKQAINYDLVEKVQSSVLDNLRCMNYVGINEKALSKTGWTVDRSALSSIKGKNRYDEGDDGSHTKMWTKIFTDENMTKLIRHDAIHKVLKLLSKGKENAESIPYEPYIFDPNYTWLRIKSPMEFTPEHADLFYFKQFTSMYEGMKKYDSSCLIRSRLLECTCHLCGIRDKLKPLLRCDECHHHFHLDCMEQLQNMPHLEPSSCSTLYEWYCKDCTPRPTLGTCWIPIGDVDVEQGTLLLLPKSDSMPNFDRPLDSDAQFPRSYFKNGKGLTWHTGSFKAGDLIFFDSRLIHCSSKNYTQDYRMSLDLRWYLSPIRPNTWHTTMGTFIMKHARKLNGKINLKENRKLEKKKNPVIGVEDIATNVTVDGTDNKSVGRATRQSYKNRVSVEVIDFTKECEVESIPSEAESFPNRNHIAPKKKEQNSSKVGNRHSFLGKKVEVIGWASDEKGSKRIKVTQIRESKLIG